MFINFIEVILSSSIFCELSILFIYFELKFSIFCWKAPLCHPSRSDWISNIKIWWYLVMLTLESGQETYSHLGLWFSCRWFYLCNQEYYWKISDFSLVWKYCIYLFHLIFQGCDEFTHNFLRKLGTKVNRPRSTPADPYTQHRQEVSYSMSIMSLLPCPIQGCHWNFLRSSFLAINYLIMYFWYSYQSQKACKWQCQVFDSTFTLYTSRGNFWIECRMKLIPRLI